MPDKIAPQSSCSALTGLCIRPNGPAETGLSPTTDPAITDFAQRGVDAPFSIQIHPIIETQRTNRDPPNRSLTRRQQEIYISSVGIMTNSNTAHSGRTLQRTGAQFERLTAQQIQALVDAGPWSR